MRHSLLLLLACATALAQVPVIFDTDMGNDIDDALALGLLHALETRGECKIIAVTITKDNPWAAPFIDILDRFYGHPSIPIGMVKNSAVTPQDSPMVRVPSERKRADGSFVYPHTLMSGADAPDALAVLRRALESQPDHSVVIVQVGFSTNLAHLLEDSRALVDSKVKLLVMMAGDFAKPNPEFNVKMDIPAAQKLVRGWPTPIVTSGFEIGNSMLFPASSITRDFRGEHPVADAYRSYMKFPYNRPTWDVTAALYAVRPGDGYFGLSEPGSIQGCGGGRNAGSIRRRKTPLHGDERRAEGARARSDDPSQQRAASKVKSALIFVCRWHTGSASCAGKSARLKSRQC